MEQPDPTSGNAVKHYLVKWRSLPYEDATWELEDDVDPVKIKAYLDFRQPPSRDFVMHHVRPHPSVWRKYDRCPSYKNDNVLREYQLEGLNWLTFSWCNGRNCILADEMGLGKTIQSIAFLKAVTEYGIKGPFLIIAPLSTIPNWQREFEGWTDINVVVYHGSSASRNMIQEYEMYYKDLKTGQRLENIYKFQVLITTFEVMLTDCLELREIQWRVCVIDEAHRLKNRNCKLLEGLRLLEFEHRILLSGTPLQNNVNELFSLLNFLEPEQFECQSEFLSEFGDLKSESQVQKLQALLKPMMLRRLKGDVEKSIAPKEETIIEVELTNMQKKYYRAILERNFQFLAKGASSGNVPNLMNTMMELRKCCIHPFLISGAEEGIQQDWTQHHPKDDDAYHNAMIHSSGKLVLVDKLLPKLKAAGHRVLLFSQMVKCLDILEDYMIQKKYPYERIDGRIRGNLRQAAIDRFSKPDSDRFVFLLCTKAGGLGINLTAADTVIIYDSDWNPQNDIQAQARCHRIGQEKLVKVYRLICRNTYEREMFDKASKKLGLDKAVLQSMNTAQGGKDAATPSQQLTKKEIEDLLKQGAYGALMDDDNAGDKFCEEDIDQILQRRTQIITLEMEKGSSFSKASFAATGNRSDISIEDPDFWQKWAKKADIDTDKDKKELIMDLPRRRVQTRRFGGESAFKDSDEESSNSDSDEEDEEGGRGSRSKKHSGRHTRSRNYDSDYNAEDAEVEYGRWSRNECFKVEKGLLTYGWGRWAETYAQAQFRSGWRTSDIEDTARIILLYCLKAYKGDDKIKGFIWDLITPDSNTVHRNHIGLNAPVPRGRKGKKKAKEAKMVADLIEGTNWVKHHKYDPDNYLDSSYKKHLNRHSNKVLLRVRMLYYIKHEVIGPDLDRKIATGVHSSELKLIPPDCNNKPAPWWDQEADKSLLIGTYKHGYERWTAMRLDPTLCFLERCGPPDDSDVKAELERNNEDLDKSTMDDEDEDTMDDGGGKNDTSAPTKISEEDMGKLTWPSTTDLNTRLRRLVTNYQRNFKKEETKNAAKIRRMERQEKMELMVRERELKKVEMQQRRWSRREEADFSRTVTTFGVEWNRKEGRYDWTKFRQLSHLDRKYDETLTEYYKAFYTMLKRVAGKPVTEEEENLPFVVDAIPEPTAKKFLHKIDLLKKLRTEIVVKKHLKELVKVCESSVDLPEWWVCGKHDRDLLVGAAKHGLARMDVYLLHDPELSFKDILKRHMNGEPLVDAEELERRKKVKEMEEAEEKVKKEDVDKETEQTDEKVDEEKVEKKEEEEPEKEPTKLDDKETENKEEKNTDETPSKETTDKVEDKENEESEVKKEVEDEEKETKEENVEEKKSDEVENKKPESVKVEEGEESKTETNKKEKIELPQSVLNMSLVEEVINKHGLPQELEEGTIAKLIEQSYQNPIRWPKDKVLQMRIEHVISAIESGKWTVPKYFSLLAAGIDLEDTPQDTPDATPRHESSTPLSFSEESLAALQDPLLYLTPDDLSSLYGRSPSRRGRRRKADIENERGTNREMAKLYMQLKHSLQQQAALSTLLPNSVKHYKEDDSLSEDSRSTPVNYQPPPAHQHSSSSSRSRSAQQSLLDLSVKQSQSLLDMAKQQQQLLDLSKHNQQAQTFASLMQGFGCGLPMDLSSFSKMSGRHFLDAAIEAESMALDLGKKSHSKESVSPLENLKRKAEEQPKSKDSKKKKKGLNDIVMGLAKSKDSPAAPPSVSIFSASKNSDVSPGQSLLKKENKKSSPSITITPVSSSGSELLNLQKEMKDAKVNKWLADQANIIPDRPVSPQFSSRGGKSRLDPSLLDWNRLTGEENVPVIHRSTGKKITGSQAPQLKNLAQWLLDNPMYDVDPKWSDLVKSKGNLPDQLAKRVSVEKRKGPGRPSLDSPVSSTATSLSGMGPSYTTTGLSGLSGLNPALFGSLPVGGLDPKNPLNFLPFAGLPPNLGQLNPLFAGFGLGGLGLPPELLAEAAGQLPPTSKSKSSSKKDKKSSTTTTSSSSMPNTSSAASSFPFLFPNPSLMYGLSGLGLPPGFGSGAFPPFTSGSSLSAASLLNGLSTASSAKTTTSTTSSSPQLDSLLNKKSSKKSPDSKKQRHGKT